jgi:hypothetical protein
MGPETCEKLPFVKNLKVSTLDFFVADEDWVSTQDRFQLQRSGMFLAAGKNRNRATA